MKFKSPDLTAGFDVTWMNADNRAGGIFQYAFRLISAMVKYTDVNVITLVEKGNEHIFETLKGYKNFKTVFLGGQKSFVDVINREKIDVLHTPKQNYMHYTVSVPMINTLHDLQPFYYPEYFSKQQIEWRNLYYRKSAEFSERVIVSFDHVKEDIVKFYNIQPDKIDVCPLGMSFPEIADEGDLSSVTKKYNIPAKYLFYSANTWPHKNHINLIRALKVVHARYGIKISLVCTGQKIKNHFNEIEKNIDELGLEDYVNFTGYVSDEEMHIILKNSALVVIPTLYEAGSFPLIEAMANEVPVICSNVTSLPDTIGDPRFIFEPKNVEQMAEKIACLLNNEKLTAENMANSREKIVEKGWDKTVWQFIKTYHKAVENFNKKKEERYFTDLILNYEFFMNDELKKISRTETKKMNQINKVTDDKRCFFLNRVTAKIASLFTGR